MSDADEVEYGYTAWTCENCGHETPKNTPPCDRCGGMNFERIEVRGSDFADEIRGPSNLQLLRENALTVGAGVAILLVVALLTLANVGVVVLSDPLGMGYRYGAVDATTPDGDGTLTAAEFHGRVAAAHDDTGLEWYGQELRLSYRSSASSNGALADELTQVATWYAAYVADGGDAARLQVTATLADGRRVRVTVASADARAFAAGDISESEYRSRIFEQK